MRTDARAAAAAAAGDAREEERGEAVAGGGSSAKVSAAHDVQMMMGMKTGTMSPLPNLVGFASFLPFELFFGS